MHKLVLLEESLKILEFFVVLDVETEGECCVNLINTYFSHQIEVVRHMTMLQQIIIYRCARQCITHLMWI